MCRFLKLVFFEICLIELSQMRVYNFFSNNHFNLPNDGKGYFLAIVVLLLVIIGLLL